MRLHADEPNILCAGHISLDIIPNLDGIMDGFQSFQPGNIISVDGVRFFTGGAVLNTGLALHRLNERVRLFIPVGTDIYGGILKQLVHDSLNENERPKRPPSEAVLVESNGETPFTLVLSPKDVDRLFLTCAGTNSRFDIKDVLNHLSGIELFHFGYPPLLKRISEDGGNSLASVLAILQAKGIVTSVDMCMPDFQSSSGHVDWRSFMQRVLPYVDVFMPSFQEISLMLYPEIQSATHSAGSVHPVSAQDLHELSQTLLSLGAKMVGIKLGDQGLYVRTGEFKPELEQGSRPPWWHGLHPDNWNHRELYIPCYRVPVAGTTGAGDSTIAGFLTGMLHQRTLEQCMVSAVAVGAFSVERIDATSGIGSWEQVQKRIHDGWPRSDPNPFFGHWKVTEDGIYRGPSDC